jgi:inner membrane protein
LDPLTHVLTGVAISRSGLNRKTALSTLTLAIAAEIPDVDIVLRLKGPVTEFAHHRGITHTFVGAPFMAAAALGVVYLIAGRPRTAAIGDESSPPRWPLLYAYALLGVLSHLLLDFTNNYGLRPLDPFNYRWFAWDIVFIVDPIIMAALLFALIAPWFSGLISGEIGARRSRYRGRGSAITALVCMVLVWWVRDYSHRRAITLLNQQTYQDQEPIRVSASPNPFNPFSWLGIVETQDFFMTLPVDSLAGEVDPQRTAVTLYKPEETPITLAAKKSPLGRAFLDWARYPYVETEVLEAPQSGFIVHMHDLRFAYPWLSLHGVPLSMSIRLDKKLNVVSQSVGSSEER